ncbi:MAG: hypothetical protein SPK59_03135 [Eubacteriales bacterium]|nr:hypothetical protein [Eubacteriales bacterium]
MADEHGNKIKLLVLSNILCKNTDENHAMNADEIREELAKRGISVMRKVVATDIAALNKFGYVNAFSNATTSQQAAVKLLLGEIGEKAKNPVSLKGFFERETD